jgi:dolichyl-diphosphooligosaccharide--protein glycosyltransferase
LTEAQANNVLQYSHPDHPRDVVFVASSDMLQKAGWWTYFGTWNFAEQNSTSLQYMVSTTTANITPGHSGTIPLLDENGISFNAVIHRGANGTNNTTGQVQAVFDNNNTTVSINGTNYNPLKASNVMVIEDNYLTKNETIHGATDGNYTLFILGNNNTYNAILIDNKLVDSMFTRLFLLGGNGQNQFQMIHMESGVSLWKVNNNATSTSTSVTNSTG